jgi:hypothetical protein
MENQNPTFELPQNDENYAQNVFNIICGELFDQIKKDPNTSVAPFSNKSVNYENILKTYFDMVSDTEKENKFFSFLREKIEINDLDFKIVRLFEQLKFLAYEHFEKEAKELKEASKKKEEMKNKPTRPYPGCYYSYEERLGD